VVLVPVADGVVLRHVGVVDRAVSDVSAQVKSRKRESVFQGFHLELDTRRPLGGVAPAHPLDKSGHIPEGRAHRKLLGPGAEG
jgi:hypothetical protein